MSMKLTLEQLHARIVDASDHLVKAEKSDLVSEELLGGDFEVTNPDKGEQPVHASKSEERAFKRAFNMKGLKKKYKKAAQAVNDLDLYFHEMFGCP